MLDYFQALRIASENGVTEEIIEKAFFIEFLLYFLMKEEYFKKRLVFRGGSALKKIYFPDYRFSEDLDFLVEDREILTKFEQRLNQLIEKINYEYPFQLT